MSDGSEKNRYEMRGGDLGSAERKRTVPRLFGCSSVGRIANSSRHGGRTAGNQRCAFGDTARNMNSISGTSLFDCAFRNANSAPGTTVPRPEPKTYARSMPRVMRSARMVLRKAPDPLRAKLIQLAR